ncbi:NAD(P)-binding domain-containing protein [Corynebacterium breve]|uniref:NAD(P)-binding domain-containing protein n=1 Tax=Corynebacterium breve TaxID=3049799 RepID=A0ABY8VF97_9CORY|nr:NAD(P)-binding domain-containing protein [Corynebacterium breve]WIM67435.1 NAD(P)-binding domain-containing protein [Corynebacterium breve]
MSPTEYPVIIIGAGQAGLAAAHEVQRRGITNFLILDANDGPGGAWRHRWDSLTLGKSHGIADLPGLPLDRPDPTVPASEVVAKYYGAYEQNFDLPVHRPARVAQVTGTGPFTGPLTVTLESGEQFTAEVVINATGTWDSPYIPYIPGINKFAGQQLHTKHYRRKEDFAGKRTLVVGGGLSAVQFLLELESVTETIWATRRPPQFVDGFGDSDWGLNVEKRVRENTFAGKLPASVVANTGIPLIDDYLAGVESGALVSRGMFNEINSTGVRFGASDSSTSNLVVPESWSPFPAGHEIDVDVIFWNTGFRAHLPHLAPLQLREPGGGITMADEVTPARNPRVLLAGYGSTASTVGANRAGRLAGRAAARLLSQ